MRVFVYGAALASIGALACGLVVFACKSEGDSCACSVEQNGERQQIACGDVQCVGGVSMACSADAGQVESRGACAQADSGAPQPDAGGTSGDVPPPDHSCDDLRSFCDVSCQSPASVAADCQAVAGTGDPAQCAAWSSSNSSLCKP